MFRELLNKYNICVLYYNTYNTCNIYNAYNTCMCSGKVPMFNLNGQGDKMFAVDWPNASLIISGGADSSMHVCHVYKHAFMLRMYTCTCTCYVCMQVLKFLILMLLRTVISRFNITDGIDVIFVAVPYSEAERVVCGRCWCVLCISVNNPTYHLCHHNNK